MIHIITITVAQAKQTLRIYLKTQYENKRNIYCSVTNEMQ